MQVTVVELATHEILFGKAPPVSSEDNVAQVAVPDTTAVAVPPAADLAKFIAPAELIAHAVPAAAASPASVDKLRNFC